MVEVTEVGRFERAVTVTLPPEAIETGRRKAAARLSQDAKVKGFRPGKAPVKVVESMIGAEQFRREAIEEALPPVVTAALDEAGLQPAVTPRVIDIADADGEVAVKVQVTLWPTLDEVPEYAGKSVAVEIPEVGPEDVDEQIERMRHQFATLEDVGREGFDGDFVLIDVATTLAGSEYAPGSAKDLLYEIGSGSFLEGMDESLRGAGAGSIVSFQSRLPEGLGPEAGEEVGVRILVKQVKAKRLPVVSDEWVAEVSGLEGVEAMRSDLMEQMTDIRRRSAWRQVEERVLADLIDAMSLDVPEALVDAEMESVLHRFAHRLEGQGVGLDQYLQLTGQDESAFVADLRSQAVLNLKTRVLLESVADQEGITVTAEELEHAVNTLARAAKVPADEYLEALTRGDGVVALAGDILRRKAVDRILDLVVPVDAGGAAVELPARHGSDGPKDAEEGTEPDGSALVEDEDGPEPVEVQE
ncbi:MAG: trigger factor [Acidimicrobiia bacterium]|nr:MAG: trigger factor [Acidimicrobiia bacterium]